LEEKTQEDGLVDDVPVQNTNPVELASARQVAHEEYMEEVEAREEHPPLSITPTAPLGQFIAQFPPLLVLPLNKTPKVHQHSQPHKRHKMRVKGKGIPQ
jgi:hypothetical protein